MKNETMSSAINDYLEKRQMSVKMFALKCGISTYSVYNYLNGKNIDQKIAAKIERRTKGEILYEELTGEDPPERLRELRKKNYKARMTESDHSKNL